MRCSCSVFYSTLSVRLNSSYGKHNTTPITYNVTGKGIEKLKGLTPIKKLLLFRPISNKYNMSSC